MRIALTICFITSIVLLSSCGSDTQIGQPPAFTDISTSEEYFAMNAKPSGHGVNSDGQKSRASLWHAGPTSLLGDRRAGELGDLLTVVIKINDKAEISNSSKRSRKGSEKLAVPALLGIPQVIDENLPTGATTAEAIDLSSSSGSSGEGSVRRNEKLTLRIAATVTSVLANGHLRIQGRQEVRVNNELRELLVTGFVRPEDISRKNEITYDKIASARISYGGRGQISKVQKPRAGQQILDLIIPF